MIKPKSDNNQLTFCSTFEEQLDKKHPLYVLSNKINWKIFEDCFKKYYHETMGSPAKPIRMMVGLILLKHLRNISDESVVEQWSENSYYQYFCGETKFKCSAPCASSELVHFRDRIGEKGIELIFQESIRIANEISANKKKSKNDNSNDKGNKTQPSEEDVIIDTTVQEKNITFPTDDKLYRSIIKKCLKISKKEKIRLRQSYKRTIKKLSYQQRFKKSKKQIHLSKRAARKIKTIAGRLVRELCRKITPSQLEKYWTDIEIFKRVLYQKREDKNKIYSIHEPHTECISKGKAHKKYEFGNKVSIIIGKTKGVILGALSMSKNDYDGHTLPKAIEQFQKINAYSPKRAIVDLGYKGVNTIGETQIIRPESGKGKSKYLRRKMRNDQRRRAGIEGKISHLKNDYRMIKNYYKGIKGDIMNVFLAASALNLKMWINNYKRRLKYFCLNLLMTLKIIFEQCLTGKSKIYASKLLFKG